MTTMLCHGLPLVECRICEKAWSLISFFLHVAGVVEIPSMLIQIVVPSAGRFVLLSVNGSSHQL